MKPRKLVPVTVEVFHPTLYRQSVWMWVTKSSGAQMYREAERNLLKHGTEVEILNLYRDHHSARTVALDLIFSKIFKGMPG